MGLLHMPGAWEHPHPQEHQAMITLPRSRVAERAGSKAFPSRSRRRGGARCRGAFAAVVAAALVAYAGAAGAGIVGFKIERVPPPIALVIGNGDYEHNHDLRTPRNEAADTVTAVPPQAPGAVFRDCPECPEMVVAPSGRFRMGSPESEEGRYDDEGPAHGVTIARPFAVGVYEVTLMQWDACVSGGGCGGHLPGDSDALRTRPIINVSWSDAQAYVRWLSGKTGAEYRLPSESEWEYVARAGTTGPYHFGSSLSPSQANYRGSQAGPVPVGSYSANAFGLHDVHGNVWEWVEDCWNDSYHGAPADGSAWESGDCSWRVLRGGAWRGLRGLRSASRSGAPAGSRYDEVGFRVARTLTP